MSGKEEDISPARVSRLKKRRHGGRESTDNNAGNICALQNLAPGPSTKHDVNHSISTASRGDGYCKENLLNGNPSLYEYGKSSIGGTIDDHVGDNKGASVGVDANALHREVTNNTSLYSAKSMADDTSILGFMDSMEQSTLMSAIPTMLDIDLSKYKSTSEEFKQYLERAFECNMNNHTDNNNKSMNQNYNSDGVYHHLVGRIDPHPISETNSNTFGNEKQYSIAFPQCRRSTCETTSQEEDDSNHNMIWQHLNLSRKSEHGMTIPSSWYQFPETKTQTISPIVSGEPSSTGMEGKKQPPDKSAWQDDDDDKEEEETEDSFSCNNFMDDNAYAQSDHQNDVEQPPAKKPPVSDVLPHQAMNDKRQCIDEKRDQQSTVTSNEAPSQSSMKYQGKIRIISNEGATIREVFDIDNSNLVIGKLHDGDERYFLEKKTLPPPPISLLDDSDDDDESDDECVAVMRYKIALEPSDVASSSQGKCNDMVGWISDRGRFADDSYLILREL